MRDFRDNSGGRFTEEEVELLSDPDEWANGPLQPYWFCASIVMGNQIKQLEDTINYLLSDHGMGSYTLILKNMSKEDYLEEWKCYLRLCPPIDLEKIPFSLGCDKFRLSEGKNVKYQSDVMFTFYIILILLG